MPNGCHYVSVVVGRQQISFRGFSAVILTSWFLFVSCLFRGGRKLRSVSRECPVFHRVFRRHSWWNHVNPHSVTLLVSSSVPDYLGNVLFTVTDLAFCVHYCIPFFFPFFRCRFLKVIWVREKNVCSDFQSMTLRERDFLNLWNIYFCVMRGKRTFVQLLVIGYIIGYLSLKSSRDPKWCLLQASSPLNTLKCREDVHWLGQYYIRSIAPWCPSIWTDKRPRYK